MSKNKKVHRIWNRCLVKHSLVPKKRREKWNTRSKKGFFVGYSVITKGYRIWYKENNEVALNLCEININKTLKVNNQKKNS